LYEFAAGTQAFALRPKFGQKNVGASAAKIIILEVP
jgi:hypothetical protein